MNADADTLKVSATGAMKHLGSGHTKVALWSAPQFPHAKQNRISLLFHETKES